MINDMFDGEQFWTTYSSGRRPWSRINTLYNYLKTFLSRNLDQN